MKLLDHFPFPIWRAGGDGKYDFFNKAWLDFTGRKLEQELRDAWSSGVHPNDISARRRDYREAFRARAPFQLQYRLRRYDGEFRWVIDHGSPCDDSAGNFAGYIGACYDITGLRKTEETLQQSEHRFATFMDNLPGFAWMKDLEGRYTFANARLVELEPYRAVWLSKTDAELWPADIADAHRANDEAVIATRAPLQTVEPYLRGGEVCHALVSKFPIFDSSGAVAMVGGASIDITERLKAERAHAELAAIVESSNDAIIGKTLDGMIDSWNAAAERIYGYSASEVIGRSIMILAPPEEHDGIRKILGRVKRGESIEHLETTRLRKDGRQISVSLTISPIKNSKGEISGASAIARDVTEQQRAEQALRVSEQRFRELAENIREVFWLSDIENTQMFYVSPAYETVWGHSCASLYAAPKSWLDAVHPDDKEQVLATVGSRPCIEPYDVTYRIVRPDESIRWIRNRGFPVRNESDEIVRFAGLADDVTVTKQAERALSRASRQLRNLSRRRVQVEEEERRHLARELHDHVGQLITVGTLNLQLLRKTKDRPAMTGKLDETLAIFDQVLQHVRQISFDIRPPVLDDLGLAPAMRWMFDDSATRAGLASEFFADPNLTRGDVESETSCYRVGQEAVLNVIRHAQARKVWMELRNDGNALQLVVRDDGIGFDVAAAGKRVGRDRLGLVGMQERAVALGGKFECESTPGRGTEVRASFPVSLELDRIEPK